MKKGRPKVYFFDSFADMGRARIDCICFLWRFGAMPKNHVFLIGHKSINNFQKSTKSSHVVPKGCQAYPKWQGSGPEGSPGSIENRTLGPLNNKGDPDTPLGTWPGELVFGFFGLGGRASQNMIQYPLLDALPPPVVVPYWIPIQIWCNVLSWLPCLLLCSFLIEFLFKYDAISSPGCLASLGGFVLNFYSNMMQHPLLVAFGVPSILLVFP
jgi:hypothetical protein